MFDLAKILPQVYPFLMIDKIIEFEKGKYLTAVKNITANEWYFGNNNKSGQCSVSSDQYFPETLIIEAAAQTALAFGKLSGGDTIGDTKVSCPIYFIAKTEAEFFERAQIGDSLILKIKNFKMMEKQGFVEVGVSAEKNKIAEVKVFYAIKK